jgi:hypothetical protein
MLPAEGGREVISLIVIAFVGLLVLYIAAKVIRLMLSMAVKLVILAILVAVFVGAYHYVRVLFA